MQMVFYYQMIYSPETNNTIKHNSCYDVDAVINNDTYSAHERGLVLWRAVPYVLRHFLLSILLHCLMPTVRPFPLLASRVPYLPRLPRWPPLPQGPRTPPLHRPLQY
jgi:hypothetical protein